MISFRQGISLVEILVSLAIFSVGIVGLYLSIQGMNKNLQVSTQRDLEATYANMLISQVNPLQMDVETAFDVTDNNNKLQIDLPDGRKVYALRQVTSQPATGDLKEINIYFYRNASDASTNPYRHFKREFPLGRVCYNNSWTGTGQAPFYKDATGQTWVMMSTWPPYNTTASARRAGLYLADMAGVGPNAITYTAGTEDVNAPDQFPWKVTHSVAGGGNGTLSYRFPASIGYGYRVSLGLREYQGGGWDNSDIVNVYINGTLVESNIDVFEQSGGISTGTLSKGSLIKTYSTTGINDGSGNGYIGVRVSDAGSAAIFRPSVAWICLERT